MKTKAVPGRIVVAVAVLCSLALSSPSAGKNKTVESWNARIQETVQLLRAGNVTQAREKIDPVLAEMMEGIDPGKQAGHAFALALTLRALAEAGAGDHRSATWDWQVAQQLDPSIESWDLSEFGAAGQVLAQHRLSVDPAPATPTKLELEGKGGKGPQVLSRVGQPAYLQNARRRKWTGAIQVAVVVDTQGRPTYPRVIQGTHEVAMILSTFEFVRGHTFTPAMSEGQPVAAAWALSMKFARD